MEYNTQRPQLKITDYGRNIAKLIDQAKQLPTKQQRTAAAHLIVRAMAQVNPKVRQTENYKRELWQHLMILSNWELDIECPYPLVDEERVAFQPRRINSTPSRIQYRHYGACLEKMVEKTAAMPDGPEKEMLTALLIMQMKKSYLLWNRSSQGHTNLNDYTDVVLSQLNTLSGGRLHEGEIRFDISNFIARPAENNKKKTNKKKKGKK